jgi:hypothetical protein
LHGRVILLLFGGSLRGDCGFGRRGVQRRLLDRACPAR